MVNAWISAIIALTGTVSGQILLKRAGQLETFQLKWILYISSSLILYAVGFIGYYLCLKDFDISKISPAMMAATVTLVALYGFFAGEVFNFQKLVGIILAILSIIIILRA